MCNGTCTSDADGDGICDDDVDNGLDCNHDTDDDGIVDCQDPCPYGDFDDDGICDVDDPCVGVIDILGICNGHCFVNVDNDQICDDVDNCIDLEACNYADPSNGMHLPRLHRLRRLQLRQSAGCDDDSCLYQRRLRRTAAVDGIAGCMTQKLATTTQTRLDDPNDECLPRRVRCVCGGDGIAGCMTRGCATTCCRRLRPNDECLMLDECGNCGGEAYAGCMDAMACNYDANADCDDALGER